MLRDISVCVCVRVCVRVCARVCVCVCVDAFEYMIIHDYPYTHGKKKLNEQNRNKQIRKNEQTNELKKERKAIQREDRSCLQLNLVNGIVVRITKQKKYYIQMEKVFRI